MPSRANKGRPCHPWCPSVRESSSGRSSRLSRLSRGPGPCRCSRDSRAHARGRRPEKSQHPAFPGDVFEHLTAAGVHVERGRGMDMPAFQDSRRDHQVPEGGIHAAAHDHLVHPGAGHLPHGHDVAGRGGLGDERLDISEVKGEVFVVGRALVGGKLAPRTDRGPGPRGIPASVRLRGRDCWWRPVLRPCCRWSPDPWRKESPLPGRSTPRSCPRSP